MEKNVNKVIMIGLSLLVIVILLYNSLYILDQRRCALVLRFGEPVAIKYNPGLKMHIPFIESILTFDKRIQNLNFVSNEERAIVAMDRKTLEGEAFAKYRIIDPKAFYQAVQSEEAFRLRMGSVIESAIREVIGGVTFTQVLGDRSMISTKITQKLRKQFEQFGVEIIDVRLVRVSLPVNARASVYQRMRTDRQKEAIEIRARGAEEAQVIRAMADKECTVMLAQARKNADIIRGKAEEEALKITTAAFNLDSDFFNFYRSMQAYRDVFDNKTTKWLISSNGDFLKEAKLDSSKK